MGGQALLGEARHLPAQNLQDGGVLVAHVDVARLAADRPGGDQRALQEAVRVALQIVAVLEGAGLALVAVDGQEARSGLLADDAPLAPGREARAAQAAQVGVRKGLDDLLGVALARQAGAQQLVAALRDIGVEVLVGRDLGVEVLPGDRLGDALDSGGIDMVVPDLGGGRAVAAAHAGGAEHPHIGAQTLAQFGQQLLRAHHLAGDGVADANRDGGRRRLAVQHDIEVGVEGGDLVDLGHGDGESLGQRLQMARRQMADGVLDQVEVFDQPVAPQGLFALQQLRHLGLGGLLQLAALRKAGLKAAPGTGRNAAVDAACADGVVHGHGFNLFSSR